MASQCKLSNEVSERGDAAAIIPAVEVVAAEAEQDFCSQAGRTTLFVLEEKQVLHEGFATQGSAEAGAIKAITFDLQRGKHVLV